MLENLAIVQRLMKMKTTRNLVLLGALTTTPAMSFTLADAGFEGIDGLVDDGNGVGKWNPFTNGGLNSFSVSGAAPRTGSQSLRLELGAANGFSGIFQDVPVISGESMTWSGWHSLQSGSAGGTEIRIEFRDSIGNTEISRTGNLAPTIGLAYEPFSLTDIVPAGADTARVVYAVQSFGAPAPQLVHVDDLFVSGAAVVPEPSGAIFALMGLGGLALRRRR